MAKPLLEAVHTLRRDSPERPADTLLEVTDATRFIEAVTCLRTGLPSRDGAVPLDVPPAVRSTLTRLEHACVRSTLTRLEHGPARREIEAVDAPALGRFIQRDRFRPPCARKHHLVSRHGIGRFGPIGPRVLETGRTDLGYAPVAGS